MIINNIASIITYKVDNKSLSRAHYLSTENMSTNSARILHLTFSSPTPSTAFKASELLISNICTFLKKICSSHFDVDWSSDFVFIRSATTNWLTNYLFYLLNTNWFVDTCIAFTEGVEMPCEDKKTLISYNFDLLPLKDQNHIDENRSHHHD